MKVNIVSYDVASEGPSEDWSVIRGFDVYKNNWTPILNEVHPTQQEHGNNRYAVHPQKTVGL